MRRNHFLVLCAVTFAASLTAAVASADFDQADDFVGALEREDFKAASRATFGKIDFDSEESEQLHEQQVDFYADVLELFIRELGGVLKRTLLTEKPENVEWVSMVREVENEKPDDFPKQVRSYLVEFAYEGTGYLHLQALPYRVREFGFGIPDTGPESARRSAELVVKLAEIQPRRPPGTRGDVRRITIP